MTKKIFYAVLTAAAAVLLASVVVIVGCMYGYLSDVQEGQMADELSLAALAVEQEGSAFLSRVQSDRYRLTWVQADGAVLYDTKSDGTGMENHAEREEIRQALETGEGKSVRYSSTLLEKNMYLARRLTDGTVLRISVSTESVGALVFGMLQPIFIVLAVALFASALLANRLSARIVEPLNRLDLEHPLDNENVYEELTPLLRRVDRQRRQIDGQVQELQRRRNEFDQITGSMREGLVLLDGHGRVVSMNPAARALFDVREDCTDRDFLTVERSRPVSAAIDRAVADGRGEGRLERRGRVWLVDASRIACGQEVTGVSLLATDVTERENAERGRREFTANVSHELKTPLQGILGSAELMEQGLVQPEDTRRFVGHIRTEAQRLLALINDIIRLSQLDEGEEMPQEDVELSDTVREAVAAVSREAAARNVTVQATGAPVRVRGVSRLLYEMIYNLCDNGVKYNVPGGRVTVHTEKQGGLAVVTVEDTGIGIAPEHQQRVFERFYRVDKSHSRASGGTGLGLSIVKHAAAYHHGQVHLESREGKGTKITVTLPALTEDAAEA